MKVTTYLGTYTDENKAGIHILETDTDTGALYPVGVVSGIENPTYLVLSKTRSILYAVQGMPQYGAPDCYGAVSAYRIETTTLTLINHHPVRATVPCHIALNPDETCLAFAEYTHAVAGVFDLARDGALAETPPVTVTHIGSGPDKSRQETAHAHCATFTPDGRFLCITDLGSDRVVAYSMAGRSNGLKTVATLAITCTGGAGPRHLVFHPNGQFAYLLHELDNTLTAFRFTGDAFVQLQTLATVPSDCTRAQSKASALKFSADGRLLLASNRGHDSIASFDVDPDNGRIELLAISPLAGSFPRDFAFVPGDAFIVVGHETSNTVCTYAYDAANGRLTQACGTYAAHRPVCVVVNPLVTDR